MKSILIPKTIGHLQFNAPPCSAPPMIMNMLPISIEYRLPNLSTMKGTNGTATMLPKGYIADMRPSKPERG